MKKEHKDRIEYNKPELMDLDSDERIAGGPTDCQPGTSVSGYCATGPSAASSGCNSGSQASCSTGHYV